MNPTVPTGTVDAFSLGVFYLRGYTDDYSDGKQKSQSVH